MHLALSDPEEYSRIIGEAHGPFSALRISLAMVAPVPLSKTTSDWIVGLEKALAPRWSIRGFEIAFV